jgi:hypothetical protein
MRRNVDNGTSMIDLSNRARTRERCGNAWDEAAQGSPVLNLDAWRRWSRRARELAFDAV